MISFIVPAHNEQAYLPRTLEAIHEAMKAVGRKYEVIVVDDASTDATAEVARQHGARVVGVNHRQIAATRNSGARAAQGEQLIFVDADTDVNVRAVAAAVKAMDNGAVGGGLPAWVGKDEPVPLYGRLLAVICLGAKLVGFTGGAFMFCTHDAFCATGGFDERFYCSEEGGFALALKREGRFVVPWGYVKTSGRRLRKTSGFQLLTLLSRVAISPRKTAMQRAAVEKLWYDSNRADDDKLPNSIAARISNSVALVVLLILVTGPLWGFVPKSLTPLSSPLGKVRLVIGIFLCHVGLIFWPAALVLLINLFRQKRYTGVFQSVVLIAFLGWQAWGATKGVIWFWPWLCGHVMAFLRG